MGEGMKPGADHKRAPAVPFHRYANAFPLMEGAEFDAFRARMKARGFDPAHPIVRFEGKILDGRNRYRAALAEGIEPRFWDFDPATEGDPLEFVISENIDRRHLTKSQRAMAAAKLASFARGRPAKGTEGVSRDQAADRFRVSRRSVASAAAVLADGSAGLRQAVERGGVPVHEAAEVAKLPKLEQQLIASAGEDAILKAARGIRAARSVKRRAERSARIIVASDCSAESMLAGGRKVPILYADPPWQYQMGDTDRSVENKYPTMTLEDICALPVRQLATPDAVLFLWIPEPHLFCSGPPVLAAWDFQHKSGAVWDKVIPGMGHYFMVQHEHLLVCTRGAVPQPAENARPRSLFSIKKTRKHSEKPNDHVMAMIEAMYPQFFRRQGDPLAIELFARSGRPGWASWGNQAPAQKVAA